MTTITLMADYRRWPLWVMAPPAAENIDPASLPLPPVTLMRLREWAEVFNALLKVGDLGRSDFPSPAVAAVFEEEGLALWRLLQQELGAGYRVLYHSRRHGRLFSQTADLTAA
jgi:hypothetical protein